MEKALMNLPDNLLYTEQHEWAEMDGDLATVGITAYAVDQLGDITLVELPEVGQQVTAGEAVGVVESVKAVSDLYAPVTGVVAGINESLEDEPEKVNDDPYKAGWMFKVTVSDRAGLIDATAYSALLDNLEE
jgi:glycine cleavage system H protein